MYVLNLVWPHEGQTVIAVSNSIDKLIDHATAANKKEENFYDISIQTSNIEKVIQAKEGEDSYDYYEIEQVKMV